MITLTIQCRDNPTYEPFDVEISDEGWAGLCGFCAVSGVELEDALTLALELFFDEFDKLSPEEKGRELERLFKRFAK